MFGGSQWDEFRYFGFVLVYGLNLYNVLISGFSDQVCVLELGV